MKKILMVLAAVVMFGETGYAADATFHGEIMDSACAKAGAHNPENGSAIACTEACVKNGSTFVLYDASTKTTYQLDNQQWPADYAGNKVTVEGTYDKATNTIHVALIKAES